MAEVTRPQAEPGLQVSTVHTTLEMTQRDRSWIFEQLGVTGLEADFEVFTGQKDTLSASTAQNVARPER